MKIRDYVKTEDGIKKVLKYEYDERYENGHCVWFENKDCGLLFTDEEFNKMKSSPNIIDLIEVGDFIKYNPVQNHYAKKITLYKAIKDEKDLIFLKYQVQNDKLKILSIVTKEQFESMEYKVGE